MSRTMLAIVPLLACITIARSCSSFFRGKRCTIPMSYIQNDIRPLILKRNADQLSFEYPNSDNGITILKNEVIYLACLGENNHFKTIDSTNEIMARCMYDKQFTINKRTTDITTLTCKSQSTHLARPVSNQSSLNEFKHIEIGFQTSKGFIRTIHLLFNYESYQTPITHFKMSKMIGTSQKSFDIRSPFENGEFYHGINLENAYKFDTQLEVISNILDSKLFAPIKFREFIKQYLSNDHKNKQYLSRGHLVAKADFVYAEQQKSTFWYVNTAPQWLSFNKGNWNNLEISVRKFASKQHLDLDVYTGVYDIMTMKDDSGEQQCIYLKTDNTTIFVPKFFWKVIYDPLSQRGTAFVGLNNPFIKNKEEHEYLCEDISKKITWLKWKPGSITDGLSYACTIDNLREKIGGFLPPFNVSGILQ